MLGQKKSKKKYDRNKRMQLNKCHLATKIKNVNENDHEEWHNLEKWLSVNENYLGHF